ncbi:MAG: tetratricopeptide repeat protein [Pseudomonadota bacterium]
MKTYTKAFYVFIFSLSLLHTKSVIANEIIIAADGSTTQKIEQTANIKIKKDAKKKSKQKSSSLMPVSQKTSAPPTEINTADLILAPNTQGKTFRLQIKTNASPALAIITTHDGFFLILDKKYTFQLPVFTENMAFIKEIIPINDSKVLILKFRLDPYIYANFERNEKELYLTFFYRDSGSLYTTAPTPSLLMIEETQWPNITIKPLAPGGIGALITLDNTAYYVYMTQNPDGGYQHLYKTPYYETVSTQQGLAIRNFSNKTRFSIENNQIQIIHPNILSTLISPTIGRHFQNIFDVDPKRDITKERSQLLSERNNLTPPYTLEKQLQWAWIDLALNMGQEAKTYLKTTAIQYPKITQLPLYKALLGMAYFLTQEYNNALDCWKSLPNTLEISVWKQLATSALGQFDGIDQLIYKIRPIIEEYPIHLREVLIQHSLKTAENLHNLGAVNLLLGQKNNNDSILSQWLHDLYQAKIYYERKDFGSSKSFLEDMHLEKYPDKAPIELLVESELLNTLNNIQTRETSKKDAIRIFTALRLKWRGSSLEYRISQELIQLLEAEKQYSDALAQLRELKRLFPSRSGIEQIGVRMKNIYLTYFHNIKNISPLKVIKTYGDFLDVIPEGKTGDEIVKIIAEQFEHIDLLDDAAELLSRNQANKPDSPEKIEILFKIADLHMQNKKYDEALAVFNTFPQEIATIEQKSKSITMHVQAFLGENKRSAALALLNASTDPDHGILASKIYAQNKQWHEAAERLASTQYLINAQKDPKRLIAILNELVTLYFMDNQFDKLQELGKTYKELMKGQKNFEFFTRPNNNQIKQRTEAEAALADIANVSTYIKSMLDQPAEESTKNTDRDEKSKAKIGNNATPPAK